MDVRDGHEDGVVEVRHGGEYGGWALMRQDYEVLDSE